LLNVFIILQFRIMKKILVTGSNGQLGSELQQLSAFYPAYQFVFTSRQELSIEKEESVNDFFSIHQPDYCINCAAYTMVDKAEAEAEKAFLINADAPGFLAKACLQHNTRFIHISTDYVFDGTSTKPYLETDVTNPEGVYAVSKLKGEQRSFDYNPSTIVIRTSWVYSSYGNNFVKTMLRLMNERENINVVNDQIGSPTYAADLAKAIMDMVEFSTQFPEKPVEGIYNYSNEGIISWYDFAVAIRELTGSKCVIHPIPSSAYPTPVKRPAYSVFDKTKIKTVFRISIPDWKESLQRCLLQLLRYSAK